jgi:hypothetical protein
MADLKISQLTGATTPLAGTEVLPIVQSSTTRKIATDDLTVKNIRSNATTGILQVAGPAAAATRVMTTPNANFTVARTDAAQTFTGDQTFSNIVQTTSGTFLNAGASVTCTALNTYYTVQQYYFGLYVFRDGTSGGTAMVLYDSTGATIVSSTITGLAVQVLSFSTLQVRVTSGSAPRTLYWACVAAVSS